jgi:hypothetical protein
MFETTLTLDEYTYQVHDAFAILCNSPNHDMETITLHDQIDINEIFPSLFVALSLVSNPREIGCLLGLVNDIALFFIQSYVLGTDEGAEYLTTPRSFAVEYLQNFALMSTTHAHRLGAD